MPLGSSRLTMPSYRVLRVLEVPPEVVTSSVGTEETRCGQGPGPVPPDQPLFHGQYIDVEVDFDRFVRAFDPRWDHIQGRPRSDYLRQRRRDLEEHNELMRQPASCLYTFTSDQRGQVSCSTRMSQWLNELPGPEVSARATRGSPQAHSQHGAEGGHGRPRANSTPIPYSISANHMMGAPEQRRCQLDTGAATPVGPSLGGEDGAAIPPFNHPNPLGLHPIVLEQLPVQLRIPKRKSSLHSKIRGSQVTSPAARNNTAEDDLVQGIQTISLGQPLQLQGSQLGTGHWDREPDFQINNPPLGIARWNTVAGHQLDSHPSPRRRNSTPHLKLDCHLGLHQDNFAVNAPPPSLNESSYGAQHVDDTARRRFSFHVQQFFGQDTGKIASKKRDRSDTPATMEADRPAKRPREALGPLDPTRNRMSLFGLPDDNDNANDGRQSRLRRAATGAAKRMSVHLPSSRSIIRVPSFSSQTRYDRITIGFVGDSGCGKTSLLQRYSTGHYETENPSREDKDGYAIETFNLEVDGDPVKMDLWDVTSQCNYQTAADHCRPLTTAPYSVIVICFDIQDEDTLESAVYKWKNKVEMYSGGPPVILLGLKSDRRRPYPTLRLLHLDEPTGTSAGQAEQAARVMGARAYYECSAASGEGIADVFDAVVRIAMERRRRHHDAGTKARLSMFASKIKAKYQKLRD